MPFWFLKINKSKLDIDYLIFSDGNLLSKSYLINMSENNYSFSEILNNNKLFKIIFSSRNEFLTFHECCWKSLDNLIIKYKIKTTHYPVSNLNGWVNLTKDGVYRTYKTYGLKINTIISFLKYFFFVLFENKKFNYFMASSDSKSLVLMPVLNKRKYDFISIKNDAYGFKNSEIKDYESKNVLFILGLETSINDELLSAFFIKIQSFCLKKKLQIFYKFHPDSSEEFKNKFSVDKGLVIDQKVPVELLDIRYKYKIALFSMSLLFQPSRSITLDNIINKTLNSKKINSSLFKKRRKHLMIFDNYELIKNPESLEELFHILEK